MSFKVSGTVFAASVPELGGPALPSGQGVQTMTAAQTTNINLGPGSIVVNGHVDGDDILRKIERAAQQREARGGGGVRFSRRFAP